MSWVTDLWQILETVATLTKEVERVCNDKRFSLAAAILVKDHGAYIWGADLMEAKRHTEVYHFLFEAIRARQNMRR